MKKYFLIIFILIFNFNFIIAESNYSTTDNYTWLSEGYKFSLEIKDDEGNFTKIIDSKKAYMMKEGRLDNSLATAFSESLPSSGTFTGIRFTLQEWFIKAKGTIAGKVWYTNNVTDDNFTYQRFATDNISNYGEWTLSFAQMDAFNSTGGIQQESTLPSSLTMDGTNLILTATIIDDDEDGIFTTDNDSDSYLNGIYFQKEHLYNGFILGEPKKIIRLHHYATRNSNDNISGDIVMLLDDEGKFLGGNFYRGYKGNISKALLWASGEKKTDFTNRSSDGLSSDYKIRFGGTGSISSDYFEFSGSYNCDNGSATLTKIDRLNSSFETSHTINAGDNASDSNILQESGYTLMASGTTSCSDLTIN